jgi:hypothetical protein
MSSVLDDHGEIVPDLGPTKKEKFSNESSAFKIFFKSPKLISAFFEDRI